MGGAYRSRLAKARSTVIFLFAAILREATIITGKIIRPTSVKTLTAAM